MSVGKAGVGWYVGHGWTIASERTIALAPETRVWKVLEVLVATAGFRIRAYHCFGPRNAGSEGFGADSAEAPQQCVKSAPMVQRLRIEFALVRSWHALSGSALDLTGVAA